MLSSEEDPVAAPLAAEPPAAAAPPTAFTEEEKQVGQDYDATGLYEVGQVVHHRSLNKFGRVIEKTVLAGQRAAIRVRFEEGDEMTLREQV